MYSVDSIDLDNFSAPSSSVLPSPATKRPPRHKAGEWLRLAAREPGKTLHVAMALWYMAGLTKRRAIKLTGAQLKVFGVGRDAGRRSLDRLVGAGLVSVERKPGRCPVVTIQAVAEKRRKRY